MYFNAAQTQADLGAVVPQKNSVGSGQSPHLSPQQFGKKAGPGEATTAGEAAGAGEAAAGAEGAAAGAAGAGEAAAGAGSILAELAPLALL